LRILRRQGALALCLFFFSCSTSSRWQIDREETGSVEFDSAKLSFFSSDPGNGLDLTFFATGGKVKTFLEVRSRAIPPVDADHPSLANVVLEAGGEVYTDVSPLHAGGQRIVLSDLLQQQLLSLLRDHPFVDIKIDGFSSRISRDDFAKKWDSLNSTPWLENPLHLPF
jgi:hypothetical protein